MSWKIVKGEAKALSYSDTFRVVLTLSNGSLERTDISFVRWETLKRMGFKAKSKRKNNRKYVWVGGAS